MTASASTPRPLALVLLSVAALLAAFYAPVERAERYFKHENSLDVDQFQKDIAAYILRVHRDAQTYTHLKRRKN